MLLSDKLFGYHRVSTQMFIYQLFCCLIWSVLLYTSYIVSSQNNKKKINLDFNVVDLLIRVIDFVISDRGLVISYIDLVSQFTDLVSALSFPIHWIRTPLRRGVQHYKIKFVSDLRQVGGFLRVLRFSHTIKLTTTI